MSAGIEVTAAFDRSAFSYGVFPAEWGLPPSTAYSPVRESWVRSHVRKRAASRTMHGSTMHGIDALILLQQRRLELAQRRVNGDPTA